MKIGLASAVSKNRDVDENIKTIHSLAKTYQDQLDLLCFGEAFLQGFDGLSWTYETDKQLAQSKQSEKIVEIKRIARNYQVGIAFGYFELDEEEECIYCSYMVLNNKGECVDHYRRVSIGWKEYKITDAHYQEGESFHTFTYQNKVIVTALCGDLWYDENIKQINQLNKDFVLWPLHIDYSYAQWEKEKEIYIMQSAKIASPLLMINNISLSSHGGCFSFDKGKVLDRLNMGEKGVLIVEM